MRTRWTCFVAWLHKEWRDHRAVALGIFLAIPALIALGFWAFGGELSNARLRDTRTTFLGIAVGLVNFAIAASLFAGETRRGTIQLVRRLPGSFGASFLAKLVFLVLLVVTVIAWTTLCLAIAEAGNGGVATDLGLRRDTDGGAVRAMALWNQILAFPGGELWITGLGMGVLCLWTLLVSTWMGRSGVAGVGALVLLAALGAPFLLFFMAHPYFFPGPWALLGWTTAISALVAGVAVTASFLRGQRFAGRPLRPLLWGTAVLVVALGGGYAYAHVALDAWLEIDPHHEDFRIFEAHVGAGERHLYLTVHRQAAWIGDRNVTTNERKTGWETRRGTPLQAWVVDLETGAIDRVHGKQARYFMTVPEAMGSGPWRPLDPAPALVCCRMERAAEQPGALTWWDAARAQPVRTLPWGVRDPITIDLVRRTLAGASWLRDAHGRRVWLRDDIYEGEGRLPLIPEGLRPRPRRKRMLWPVPGGWYGSCLNKGTRRQPRIFLDAATGEERELLPDANVSPFGHNVLSPSHALDYVRERGDDGRRRSRRVLIPLAGGEAREPSNMPAKIGHVIGRDLVLALRGPATGRTLHAWNPVTGDDRPLDWIGPELSGIATTWTHGRTGDGRILLALQTTSPLKTAFAVLSPDCRTLRPITGWRAGWTGRPIALLEDDTLVVGEEHKRVVRYVPGEPPEVLFPRAR